MCPRPLAVAALAPLLSLAASPAALGVQVVVSEDFNAATNPGWFTVARDSVPNPALDFSGGDLNFSTGVVSNNSGGDIETLDNNYAVRPFAGVDLANVGDYIQASFTVSAAPNDGTANVIRQLRGFRFNFIGSGDETVPTGNATYAAADTDLTLDGPSSFNLGADATVGNTQVNLPTGNRGGTSSVPGSDFFFTKANGTGGTSQNQFPISLTDDDTVTLRIERVAASVLTNSNGPVYEVSLTFDPDDAAAVTNSQIAGNTQNNRAFGTEFDHFAIGSSDVFTQEDGTQAFIDFTIDDFVVTTNVPEPASLALLSLGAMMMLPRRRR
jgi:hypothetical protein